MFVARCPGCQDPLQWNHPYAVSIVCSCGVSAIREGGSVRSGGHFSNPPQPVTVLKLGDRGVWRGRAFVLAGYLRKGMDGARWNEWFLAFDDGEAGWLFEGDGPTRIYPDPPKEVRWTGALALGSRIGDWNVRRIGKARTLAANGVIPFALDHQMTQQVDLQAGDRLATLDGAESPAALFEGTVVAPVALGLKSHAPPVMAPVAASQGPLLAKLCALCGVQEPGRVCAGCGGEPRAAGRWSLQIPLGHGSTGTTWAAIDETGRTVALKEMRVPLALDETAYRLAVREVEVLRQLNHPGIPKYFGHETVGAGRSRTLWLAMERIEGQSLQSEWEGRRYTTSEVRAIVEELASILEYLHGLSPPVVHRDVKPTNVLRRPKGPLVLIDFGSVTDRLGAGDMTVVGTFGYMAPEQFGGQAVPASDFYALGALAAQLITRKPPQQLVDGQRRLKWRAHASEDLPWLDGLLEPDPEKRTRSVAGLDRKPQQGFWRFLK